MAVTLASDEFSDAEITDGIGLGELSYAARLWVRHWPTALAAAREYVVPAEVPGLAAEALIGTVVAIAIGRGPRDDVAGFVTAAVRELGEDDEPGPPAGATAYPEVFVSPLLTSAFAELDAETQNSLRRLALDHDEDDDIVRALTVLQHYYLAEHADRAEEVGCRRAHIALMSVADGSSQGLSGDTWLHLSSCAWCTAAFHDVAFSSVALDALIDRTVLAPPLVEEPEPAAPLLFEETAPLEPPLEQPLEPPLEPLEPAIETAVVPAVVPVVAKRPRRRGRLAAVALLTAAAVAVGAIVLNQRDHGRPAPAAAGTDPTQSAVVDAPSATSSSPAPTSPTAAATKKSTAPKSVVTPAANATPTPTPTPTRTRTPKPTPPPSPKPTSRPTPSSTPTTSTPTPSPTATPTKKCSPLQHLLGFC